MNKISIQQLASQLPDDLFGSDFQVKLGFVRLLFDTVSTELSAGSDVTVKGLGRFFLTGNELDPVGFEPDKSFAESVNAPFAGFSPEPLSPDVTDEMLSQFDLPVTEKVAETVEEAGQVAPEPEPVIEAVAPAPVEDDIFVPEPQPPVEVSETTQPIGCQNQDAEPEYGAVSESAEDIVGEPGDVESLSEPISEPDDAQPVVEIPENEPVYEEKIEQEEVPEYEEEEEQESVTENSSSGFSTGFLVGLITGLAVGAIAFLLYVMFYVNRTTYPLSDDYGDEEDEYVIEENSVSDSLSVF